MAIFSIAITNTLTYEDGLSQDPNDAGGITNFGISLNAHPELTADEIHNMTREQAEAIYQKDYWNPLYDQITDQRLANTVFDFGVNAGTHIAVQTLQGIIFGRGGGALDGIFGPATIKALLADDQTQILKEYTVERLRYYAGLSKAAYLHSWFERTISALI